MILNTNADGSRVIAESTGGDVIWYYYDSDGVRTAMEYKGDSYYYVYNLQGDVLALVDEIGEVVVRYTYDSWGNILSVTGSMASTLGVDNPFRYRGYYYDEESGLYYLNSRYYDPVTRRFVNADRQLNSDILGNNLFAYCGNNPVNRSDSSGMWWLDDLCNGIVNGLDALFPGLKERGEKAFTSPYNFGNWLTLGAFDSIKGTFFPEKPLSVQHWIDSANTAFMLLPAVKSGTNLLSSPKTFTPKASPKVSTPIKNDIIDLPRVGSALRSDAYHAFPNIVDNYAAYATQTPIHNGTLYQLQGSLNGVPGRFEWITQNNQVTHRMFVKGGSINGIQIMP